MTQSRRFPKATQINYCPGSVRSSSRDDGQMEIGIGEKMSNSESGTATVVYTEKQARQDQKPKRQPRYQVILWDDDDHSYEYVVLMMRQLFGHPFEKGFELAKQVDNDGRVVCLTTTREHAELKRDQIHAFGKDMLITRCKGSMSATIEPIE